MLLNFEVERLVAFGQGVSLLAVVDQGSIGHGLFALWQLRNIADLGLQLVKVKHQIV